MMIRYHLKRAVGRPPHQLARRLVGLAHSHGRRQAERWRDQLLPSFARTPGSTAPNRLFQALPLADLEPYAIILEEDAQRTLEHRFDLLGSGLVSLNLTEAKCRRGPDPTEPGAEAVKVNRSNLRTARHLLAGLSPGYRRVDWHCDARSGARWAGDVPYDAIRYGDRQGVDVKFPWELSRLQHLPRLALTYQLGRNGNCRAVQPDACFREFRDQLIDFRASNPPRFGVNWACTMDVGIRAINLIAAHDLFAAAGAIDEGLTRTLVAMIREHGRHIRTNLEWASTGRGNHYLCNIAGLLFAACWLPSDRQTDVWRRFAWRELLSELDLQFNPDGSNIEGSIVYHRLSAEAVLWCIALVCGRVGDRKDMGLPGGLGRRLQELAGFTRAITKPDGLVPQIGDNDSGRVLKPLPDTETSDLDHRGFVAAVDALLGAPSVAPCVEVGLVRSLAGGATLAGAGASTLAPGAFEDFGIYILQGAGWHVSFRCGGGGWRTGGNHTHNDQLSFELTVDGQPIIVDTGTFAYTSWPDRRNRFRGTAMHNTLQLDELEQNPWLPGREGLFRLENRARGQLLHAEGRTLEGMHHGFGHPHLRRLTLMQDALIGVDRCDAPGLRHIFFHLDPAVTVRQHGGHVELSCGPVMLRLGLEPSCNGDGEWAVETGEVSRRYGQATPAALVAWRGSARSVSWSIRRM